MVTDILSFISILTAMLVLRSLVSIFPSLVACLVRAKECFNLEASVKLSRSRDIIATVMVLPFCLLMNRFDIIGTACFKKGNVTGFYLDHFAFLQIDFNNRTVDLGQ